MSDRLVIQRIEAMKDSSALLILLPGAYRSPDEFLTNGYVSAVHEVHALPADIWMLDAKVGDYQQPGLVEDIHEQVLIPARREGYGQVWMAGISIGGFAALGCAARFPDQVDGVLAVAPYLGRIAFADIQAHGGPAEWRAGKTPDMFEGDLTREIWWWLCGKPQRNIHLGFGRSDRFAEVQEVAARLLGDRGFSVDGRHDWDAWRSIWHRWLDDGHLSRAISSEAPHHRPAAPSVTKIDQP